MNLHALGMGSASRRERAALDYSSLVAGLAAAHAATRTGALALRRPAGARPRSLQDALVALFAGSADWTSAAGALRHSFHPAVARAIAATPCQS